MESGSHSRRCRSPPSIAPCAPCSRRRTRPRGQPRQPRRRQPRSPRPSAAQSAALMRVNHAGEIAAQALYHGQAAGGALSRPRARCCWRRRARGIRSPGLVRDAPEELGARPSLLNPLWYAGSFAIGAAGGAAGRSRQPGLRGRDRAPGRRPSRRAPGRLPASDARSRAIVEPMRADEIAHGAARARGGAARAARAGPRADATRRACHDRHRLLDLTCHCPTPSLAAGAYV